MRGGRNAGATADRAGQGLGAGAAVVAGKWAQGRGLRSTCLPAHRRLGICCQLAKLTRCAAASSPQSGYLPDPDTALAAVGIVMNISCECCPPIVHPLGGCCGQYALD